LFGALPAIANGMIVCLLIVFIYAIAGVNLFKGKFYRCLNHDPDFFDSLDNNIITKEDCLEYGGHWINSQNNFDNIFNSAAVLFQIITTEGWLDIMYLGIDAVGVDKQPKKNNSQFLTVYFISFVIVGNIFVLNLFVGIVIDKFNRLKDRMCGYALMTSNQKEWIESEKQMIRL
jgi:voltage-dependent calcium channel T type alpha-1I